MKRISTVIVDDEPLALQQLRGLVQNHDRLELVGEASDGIQAVKVIQEVQPELVFLDIRMPGKSGLEVVEALSHDPRIIFTTAYEEFAVVAFELQALDYLLKPFGRRRFEQAVSRLASEADDMVGRVRSVVNDEPLRRLFVRDRGKVRQVPVDEIRRIEAADDYANIYTASSNHLISCRMKMLERVLDSTVFVRVHRSTIVNLNFVREMASCGNGRYEITMDDDEILKASRSGAARLRDLIGSDSI